MHPELYSWLGVDPPRGVLLHGPPGCGKTTLAHAIAREAGVPFFSVAAPEIVAGVSGESEAKIRQLFAAASAAAPSIVFIDEVDAIVPKRESAGRQMESRIVAQLLASMDALNDGGAGMTSATSAEATDASAEDEYAGAAPRRAHVTVIGATNRPDGMDAAMRRAGRFDREIMLGIPDEAARGRILAVQAKKLRLAGGLDLAEIARRTPGYVGADLSALAKEAAASAVSRIFTKLAGEEGGDGGGEGADAGAGSGLMGGGRLGDRRPLDVDELSSLAITTDDFALALTRVQPSAQREGFTTTPEVTWEDVGSLTEVREELAFSVVEPIAHPARFQAMGLAVSTGVLLYGPPGCGKTLVAKATANEANANFISIKGPELLNKYVGESERAVRTLFARARAAAPCVLFFDELDSLAPRRGNDSGNQASERVVNQLLTEMDGLEARSATFVVAATNRPDMIDPAMLRPGRLDKLLYVPLPPPDGRAAILRTLTRKTPLAPGLDVARVGESGRCGGFSGADLASLVREACVAALKGNLAAATAHDEARERARIAAGGGEAGAKAAAEATRRRRRRSSQPRISKRRSNACSPPSPPRIRGGTTNSGGNCDASGGAWRRRSENRRRAKTRTRRRARDRSKPRRPPRRIRAEALDESRGGRDTERRPKRERCREGDETDREDWSSAVAERRVAKLPSTPCDLYIASTNLAARSRSLLTLRTLRNLALVRQRVAHHLLRERTRVWAHAAVAPAPIPHAVKHAGARLFVDVDTLARRLASLRSRVPHPVPLEGGMFVQGVVNVFVRRVGKKLLQRCVGRRLVIGVEILPSVLELRLGVWARVRAERRVASPVRELAEEHGVALFLAEAVPLANRLATLRARVFVIEVLVMVARQGFLLLLLPHCRRGQRGHGTR